MSVKHTEKLEKEFKEYTESSPSEDKVIELDTNIPVIFLSNDAKFSFLSVVNKNTELFSLLILRESEREQEGH